MSNYKVVTDQRKGAARLASTTWAWVGAVCTLGYLLPWAVAATRGARNSAQVFWLNLLLGWTLVGWVVALVMAFRAHRAEYVIPAPPVQPFPQPFPQQAAGQTQPQGEPFQG